MTIYLFLRALKIASSCALVFTHIQLFKIIKNLPPRKISVLALAFFVVLFAFAAKLSLAARHEPLMLHSDGRELLRGTSNCDIVTQLECNGKSSWPELVGVNGEIAAEKIAKENPYVRAIIILEGSPVTGDFRCDRVRVFVDKDEKVVQVPQIG